MTAKSLLLSNSVPLDPARRAAEFAERALNRWTDKENVLSEDALLSLEEFCEKTCNYWRVNLATDLLAAERKRTELGREEAKCEKDKHKPGYLSRRGKTIFWGDSSLLYAEISVEILRNEILHRLTLVRACEELIIARSEERVRLEKFGRRLVVKQRWPFLKFKGDGIFRVTRQRPELRKIDPEFPKKFREHLDIMEFFD